MHRLLFLDRISDIVTCGEACKRSLMGAMRHRTAEDGALVSGERERELLLVLSGIARVYINTHDGKDVTQFFARSEDLVVANLHDTRGAIERVEAVTDLAYVTIAMDVLDELTLGHPELLQVHSALYNDRALRDRERRERHARREPDDNYASFLMTHPGLETQVPTAHLASFLGLSTSQFMRARQKYRDRAVM